MSVNGPRIADKIDAPTSFTVLPQCAQIEVQCLLSSKMVNRTMPTTATTMAPMARIGQVAAIVSAAQVPINVQIVPNAGTRLQSPAAMRTIHDPPDTAACASVAAVAATVAAL